MPPTGFSPESSTRPKPVHTLVTLELQYSSAEVRLRAFGHPVNGVRTLREWRFAPGDVTAPLLNELGATMDELSVAALLGAFGVPLELALDLQDAAAALRDEAGR